MAARYWRLLLLGELGFAVVIATTLRVTFNTALTPAMLTGLGVWLLLPGVLVGASFVVAGGMSSAQRPRGAWIESLRAWVRESAALARATFAMALEPWRRFEYVGPGGGAPQPANPVLLIHGVVCNRGIWRPLARVLRAHGFGPIAAVNLEPPLGNIGSHAEYVAQEIRQLRRDCGGARVAVIAHSMGGLVARDILRLLGPDDISRIITLGSPHHGSWWARALPGLACRQMEPGSCWLTNLNAAQEGRFPVAVTCIYSLNDNLIMPSTSAILKGATSVELKGLGHLSLLSARPAIDCTLATLIGSRAGRKPCPT